MHRLNSRKRACFLCLAKSGYRLAKVSFPALPFRREKNLAVWFGLHTLFADIFEFRAAGTQVDVPVPSSISVTALALTAALIGRVRFNIGTLTLIAAAAIAGVAIWLAPQILALP